MKEIPADVMRAAIEAASIFGVSGGAKARAIYAAARAILAERERCARIARKMEAQGGFLDPRDAKIAAAIERGEQP